MSGTFKIGSSDYKYSGESTSTSLNSNHLCLVYNGTGIFIFKGNNTATAWLYNQAGDRLSADFQIDQFTGNGNDPLIWTYQNIGSTRIKVGNSYITRDPLPNVGDVHGENVSFSSAVASVLLHFNGDDVFMGGVTCKELGFTSFIR